MLLLSALFFRPARDKCTYSINKASDLKCSPALEKKEKCEVLSWFSISSSSIEFAEIPDEKVLLFFSCEPLGRVCVFHCSMEISAQQRRSAPLCLCKVTPGFQKVRVVYCSLFLHVDRGQILLIEIHSVLSQGSTNPISAFLPSRKFSYKRRNAILFL